MNRAIVTLPLAAIAELNPPLDSTVERDRLVSFIPMASVNAATSSIDLSLARPYGDAKRGFRPIQEGDVLLAKITPSFENGKLAVARGLTGAHALGSTEFHVIRPSERVLPDYLRLFLRRRSFRTAGVRYMTGTAGQLRIPVQWLRGVLVPLPSLEQQTRIVSDLDGIFSALASVDAQLDQVQANLRRYRRSVLAAAASTPDPGSPQLNGRSSYTLGDLAVRITSGSRGWRKHLNEGAGRFILAGNVHDGAVDLDGAPRVHPPPGPEAERTRIAAGDLLVTIVGEVGRTAVFPDFDGTAYVSQSVALVRPKTGIHCAYLAVAMRSPIHGQAHFGKSQYGVGRGHLLLEHLRDLPLTLPSPEEQLRIVAAVDHSESIALATAATVSRTQRRLLALRESMLNAAFGQDP